MIQVRNCDTCNITLVINNEVLGIPSDIKNLDSDQYIGPVTLKPGDVFQLKQTEVFVSYLISIWDSCDSDAVLLSTHTTHIVSDNNQKLVPVNLSYFRYILHSVSENLECSHFSNVKSSGSWMVWTLILFLLLGFIVGLNYFIH